MSALTPFQTVGPYFAILMRTRAAGRRTDHGSGTRLVIEGTLLDGRGQPVTDGLIESWQADAGGRHLWCETDETGAFRFQTVMPECTPGPGGVTQAPHMLLSVMARGVLTRYVTRVYFPGTAGLDLDPILALVPEGRRTTLMARPVRDGVFQFDIRLQGPGETAFFDL
jgi:protocatechuate 3,4-dioxygenase alpha subunit